MHIYWNTFHGMALIPWPKLKSLSLKVYWSKKQFSFILSKSLWAKINRLIKLYISFPAQFCLDFSHWIFETSSSRKSNCISTFSLFQCRLITFHNVLITCLICMQLTLLFECSLSLLKHLKFWLHYCWMKYSSSFIWLLNQRFNSVELGKYTLRTQSP